MRLLLANGTKVSIESYTNTTAVVNGNSVPALSIVVNEPFESAKVYIWAEIPIEMLDNAKTVSIRFGFNDNFDRADEKAFDCMKNRFEYNG